jgi:hypothetical protein
MLVGFLFSGFYEQILEFQLVFLALAIQFFNLVRDFISASEAKSLLFHNLSVLLLRVIYKLLAVLRVIVFILGLAFVFLLKP